MNKLQATSGLPPQAVPDQRPVASAARETRPVAIAVPASAGKAVRAVAPDPVAQSAKPQPSDEQVKKITDELQRRVKSVASELEFSVDKSSGRLIVKITDSKTKEIILQIPSDQMLELGKDLDRFQQGLLLNRKA